MRLFAHIAVEVQEIERTYRLAANKNLKGRATRPLSVGERKGDDMVCLEHGSESDLS